MLEIWSEKYTVKTLNKTVEIQFHLEDIKLLYTEGSDPNGSPPDEDSWEFDSYTITVYENEKEVTGLGAICAWIRKCLDKEELLDRVIPLWIEEKQADLEASYGD